MFYGNENEFNFIERNLNDGLKAKRWSNWFENISCEIRFVFPFDVGANESRRNN